MRDRVDSHLITLIVILILSGIVIVFDTSLYIAHIKGNSLFSVLLKHIIFLAISIIFAFIAFKISPYIWMRITPILYFIGIMLLTYLLIAGPVIKSTRRWLVIGGFTFQVSEFMKFVVVLFIAWWVKKYKERMNTILYGAVLPLVFIGIPAILIALEPSYSMSGIVAFAGIVTLFVGGMRWKYFIVSMLIFIVMFGFLLGLKGYTGKKIEKIKKVWSVEDNDIYKDQTFVSIVFVGSGRIWGTGIGKGRSKMATIPEIDRDFVFTVIGEETGFIGGIIVMIIYFLFFNRVYKLVKDNDDMFVKTSIFGISSVFLMMMIIHISTNIGIFPNTGVPLPFMTVGGSSLLMNMVSIGFILSALKERNVVYGRKSGIHSNWRNRWAHNAGRRSYRLH